MKEIVTAEEFRSYTNYCEDDPENLIGSYLDAATDIVIDYLGFDPRMKEYDEWLSGTGDYKLYLKARPVECISYLEIDNECVFPACIDGNDDYIYHINREKCFTNGVENVHVIYTAGFRKMPHVIKVAVMRIAALMLAESNGNIGITGKAFGDQSRTFINYNNYNKYLKPLDTYRIINFGV